MEFYKIFNDDEVRLIHEGSLWILENVGLRVRNEKAREIFLKHGCTLDKDGEVVKIPPKIVEEYIKRSVPKYTFRGREPEYDITLPDDRPCIITASSAPDIVDPITGKTRRATSTDIANIAFLVNELQGYDVFSISTLADDAPKGQFSLSRFYPALKNCLKPVRSNTSNVEELKKVIELGEIIAGSRETYRERPIINHHYCPIISPLTMDVNSTEAYLYCVENGFPVYASIVPNAGVSSPMTLAGTVALGNAEFLAISVLTQMTRPETPLIYDVLSTAADMRTGGYAPGGIETTLLQIAHTQMARFYNVPSGGYIGLTNSHLNDAQSGYETGMGVIAALLGGTDLFNMGGLLSSLIAFDFAKAVIDNEIAMMLKRIMKSINVNKETIALEVIKDVGPGGNFMDHDHTLKYMREEVYFPEIANRDMREIWESSGALDTHSRAMNMAKRILSRKNPAVFPEELDQRIKEHFPDLVQGNACWYE